MAAASVGLRPLTTMRKAERNINKNISKFSDPHGPDLTVVVTFFNDQVLSHFVLFLKRKGRTSYVKVMITF